MSSKTAMFIFGIEVVAMTVLNVLVSNTTGLLIIPFLAAFGGWQMGVVIGRNEGRS